MMATQLAFTYLPFMNRLFHSAPIAAAEWLPIVAVGLAIYGVIGFEKMLRRNAS